MDAKIKFTQQITAWTVEQLVKYYAQQFAANEYGRHDEELSIIMAEIQKRSN